MARPVPTRATLRSHPVQLPLATHETSTAATAGGSSKYRAQGRGRSPAVLDRPIRTVCQASTPVARPNLSAQAIQSSGRDSPARCRDLHGAPVPNTAHPPWRVVIGQNILLLSAEMVRASSPGHGGAGGKFPRGEKRGGSREGTTMPRGPRTVVSGPRDAKAETGRAAKLRSCEVVTVATHASGGWRLARLGKCPTATLG